MAIRRADSLQPRFGTGKVVRAHLLATTIRPKGWCKAVHHWSQHRQHSPDGGNFLCYYASMPTDLL